MRPVTDSFLNTVRGAHKAVFRARVVTPGLTGVNPTGTTIPILSGDVTADVNADVNATLDLTVQIDWPATSTAVGAPYGQEVYVERGVQYGNGTQEWVGLGYFRINSVEQSGVKGSIRISGEDRMANVRDGRPLQPTVFSAGTSVGALLDFVVGDVVPGLVSVYDWNAYASLLATDHVMDDDRVKFINEIVTAYGKRAYFDYQGRFRVSSIPTPLASASVWFVNSGRNGVLCNMTRTISRDGVYNGVVATGEPIGELPPVRGQALDLSLTSPTYWLGPFGKVPRFFSSSFLQTIDQCNSAAASILAGTTGVPYVVSLGVVPNPALEVADVVTVSYNEKLPQEYHVLDRITYSLSAEGEMALATRKQFLT